MAHRLAGVALITGASSGIGRAAAQTFSKAGCRHLLLLDRDEAGLSRTVSECNLDASKITLRALDIKNDSDIRSFISSIPKSYGSLDYAVNCAAITGPIRNLTESNMEEMDEVLNISLRAQMVLNRAEADAMINSESHSNKAIVNFASVAGIVSYPPLPFYSVAKSGVIAFTKLMAAAFGPHGIRTNAIAPGIAKTPMADPLPRKTQFSAANPLRRIATAEEVAQLALFLCSEHASYINGEVSVIDGGAIAVSPF